VSQGRTHWQSKDIAWWRREWIVQLGEEFGADGPAVIDWLECEAKAQNDRGFVKAGPRTVSRGCFVEPDVVVQVIELAREIGLLVDYEESKGRFTCRIVWYEADQRRAAAAGRKADQRAREAAAEVESVDEPGSAVDTGDPDADVTPSHAKSRSVTESHLTGENRTGEHQQRPKSTVEPRLDRGAQHGQQVSELFAYWQERCGHPHAKLTDDRRAKIRARLREGYTVEQIRAAIDGAAKAATVDDDTGRRYDDIELICRKGSKLEDFIARAGAAPRRAKRGGNDSGQRQTEQVAWCLKHFPDLCDGDSPHPGLLTAIFRLGGLGRIVMPDDDHKVRQLVQAWIERAGGQEEAA
jgi:uncharacterized phage protein (TIGR02220 family)